MGRRDGHRARPRAVRRPRAGRVPVAEYAERWRQVQDHRDTTAALYERVLRLHVYPVLGARPLSSVRHTDARAFVTGLNRTMAPNTARQVHAITRTIFAAAVSDRLIAESPFLNIRLPAVQRDKVQPLAVDDVRRIADAAPARLRALVLFAAGTGLRSGELSGSPSTASTSCLVRCGSTGSWSTSPADRHTSLSPRRGRACAPSRSRRSPSTLSPRTSPRTRRPRTA